MKARTVGEHAVELIWAGLCDVVQEGQTIQSVLEFLLMSKRRRNLLEMAAALGEHCPITVEHQLVQLLVREQAVQEF